jgi:hypothetical protein
MDSKLLAGSGSDPEQKKHFKTGSEINLQKGESYIKAKIRYREPVISEGYTLHFQVKSYQNEGKKENYLDVHLQVVVCFVNAWADG